MAFSHNSSDGRRSPTIQAALGDIVTHGHQLLINRLDLMQVELRSVGELAVKRSVDIALAMLLVFSGFVLLTAAAVMGLSQWCGAALALTIVGGVYAVLGLIFVGMAKKAKPLDLTTSLVPGASAQARGHTDGN